MKKLYVARAIIDQVSQRFFIVAVSGAKATEKLREKHPSCYIESVLMMSSEVVE